MRPSIEQLEQIRRLSDVMYGESGLAFKKHGMPETRDEAGELLRKLHAIRDNEEPDQEETMDEDTRTCAECGAEKPIDEFRKFGRGRRRECLDCDPFEKGTDDDKASYDITFNAPDPDLAGAAARALRYPVEPPKEHWCLAELRDPRLSVVKQVQKILDAKGLIDVTLEDTAEVLVQIADLDLS